VGAASCFSAHLFHWCQSRDADYNLLDDGREESGTPWMPGYIVCRHLQVREGNSVGAGNVPKSTGFPTKDTFQGPK